MQGYREHVLDEREIEAQLRRHRGETGSGRMEVSEAAGQGMPERVLDEGEIENLLLQMREERCHCPACQVHEPFPSPANAKRKRTPRHPVVTGLRENGEIL